MNIFDLTPPCEKEPAVSAVRRQGIMLCYPFEEKRLLKWQPPYFVDPKLDGERCRDLSKEKYPYRKENTSLLVSSELTPILSMPHINSALQEFRNSVYNAGWEASLKHRFDGELYSHGLSFEQIHSRVSRSVNPHPHADRIRFHIFDIWNSDLPQYERRKELMKLQKFFPPALVLVPTKLCYSLDEVLSAYESYIAEGYEGIVVRHATNLYVPRRSTYVMKFKPKKGDSYEIVDVLEAISLDGVPKSMLGSFICVDDGGSRFKVSPGVGCTEERKKAWWKEREKMIGKTLFVEYQNLTSERGVPRFGRFPFDKNIWLEVK